MVDTANGYLLRQANDILRDDLDRFAAMLREQARKYKYTPCHRTHARNPCRHYLVRPQGWVLWHAEMQRNIKRFREAARGGVEVGKISGAVGNFANIPRLCRTMYARNSA